MTENQEYGIRMAGAGILWILYIMAIAKGGLSMNMRIFILITGVIISILPRKSKLIEKDTSEKVKWRMISLLIFIVPLLLIFITSCFISSFKPEIAIVALLCFVPARVTALMKLPVPPKKRHL